MKRVEIVVRITSEAGFNRFRLRLAKSFVRMTAKILGIKLLTKELESVSG